MKGMVVPIVIGFSAQSPKELVREQEELVVGCLFVFYGISTFPGDLIPNPFLCKVHSLA